MAENPEKPVEGGSTDESTALVTYLRQLVRNYEDLVQDMSKTLTKNCDEFETVQQELQSAELSAVATESSRPDKSGQLVPFCENCGNAQKLICNLTNQVESLTKSKRLTTTLWHSSAEQIEQLENRLKNKLMTSDTAMKTTTESQIKLFQSYIARLEGRLEQTSFEKNFYRRKLLETKLEKESVIKDVLMKKQHEIDVTKANYVKEIEHLKQILETERQGYLCLLEKRLEDERKIWTKEEKERRENLKQTWLSQLKPLVLEQETLLYRESQLSEKLYQTQLELYQAKQLLWFTPHQQEQQKQQQIQEAPPASAHASVVHVKQQENSTSIAKPPDKVKFIDLKYDYPQLEKCTDEDWTTGNYRNRRVTAKQNCDHEECVQYSMHQQVLNENEKLGKEVSRLQRSNQMTEINQRQHTSRLEQRVRDLEHLNYNIQLKLLHTSNETFPVPDRRDIDTLDDDFIVCKSNRKNMNLKFRYASGGGDREDYTVHPLHNKYSFIRSPSEDYVQQQHHGHLQRPSQQEGEMSTGDTFVQMASSSQDFQNNYNDENGQNTVTRSQTRHLRKHHNELAVAEAKQIFCLKRSSSSTRDRD